MSELFGDRSDFAIEAGIEPDGHTASTVWGHMCVWCRDIALGDLNERYCGLHHAYDEFAWLAENVHRLWADEFVGLNDLAVWNFLDGKLYGYHDDVELFDGRTLEDCQRDAVIWGRFDFLTNWDEQFDGVKAFLLCPPDGEVRILARGLPQQMGRGVSVSLKGFVTAASSFARWFELQSAQLGVPCQRTSRAKRHE